MVQGRFKSLYITPKLWSIVGKQASGEQKRKDVPNNRSQIKMASAFGEKAFPNLQRLMIFNLKFYFHLNYQSNVSRTYFFKHEAFKIVPLF